MKQATVQLSEESDSVSIMNNATVSRISDPWQIKSVCLRAFISLTYENFTLKIAQEILRYSICNLMTSLPLSHEY